MSSYQLDWQQLLPKISQHSLLFQQADSINHIPFIDLQQRLATTLQQFCRPQHPAKLLLVKGPEDRRYLSLLAEAAGRYQPPLEKILGYRYEIQGNQVIWHSATQSEDNFAARSQCLAEDWVDEGRLFGSLCGYPSHYQLQTGLVHQVNGGILILPLQVLLEQPWLWMRLKQLLLSGSCHWYPTDSARLSPLCIPAIPIDLRLIVVGNSSNLVDFSVLEPHGELLAVYSEIEPEISFTSVEDITIWIGYVNWIVNKNHLPSLLPEAWCQLLQAAIRQTEDHQRLPLCPFWLANLLGESRLGPGVALTAQAIRDCMQMRRWREDYLPELVQRDIHQGQVCIETKGEAIGQLNGLSVVMYPGHTQAHGEPSRISCVVHLGDGDITDVERKTELGGNIHAKGMLIMQAYLISELALEIPFPFSASLVFEQSYSEVDGDSASLAGLCALVSALAQHPLSQQLAVTGAVDQFGRVQAVGGVNEKIEGFFAICAQRGLTSEQGVILPAPNIRQLCLSDAIVQAVREQKFQLWAVDHVSDALPLLTGIPFKREKGCSLIGLINQRIDQLSAQQGRQRLPVLLRWLTWFNQR